MGRVLKKEPPFVCGQLRYIRENLKMGRARSISIWTICLDLIWTTRPYSLPTLPQQPPSGEGDGMDYLQFLADTCRAQAAQYAAERKSELALRNLRELAEEVAVPVECEVEPKEAAA